jgi:hypothetical protein
LGEWALLKSEDIKPLIAILFVLHASEDYELSEEQILDFICQKRIAIDNYLIREILSDPSGQVPEDAIDEEIESSNVTLAEVADTASFGADDLFQG